MAAKYHLLSPSQKAAVSLPFQRDKKVYWAGIAVISALAMFGLGCVTGANFSLAKRWEFSA